MPRSLVSGSERNQVSKTFQRDALAIVDVLADDLLQTAELHPLLHLRLRLLAHVLRQVIEGGYAFAGRARSFPAGKRLIARPSSGRGPLRTIYISHSSFDLVQEIGDILIASIATCS